LFDSHCSCCSFVDPYIDDPACAMPHDEVHAYLEGDGSDPCQGMGSFSCLLKSPNEALLPERGSQFPCMFSFDFVSSVLVDNSDDIVDDDDSFNPTLGYPGEGPPKGRRRNGKKRFTRRVGAQNSMVGFSTMLQNRSHRIQGRSWFVSMYTTQDQTGLLWPSPDSGTSWGTITSSIPITPLVIGGSMIDFAALYRRYKIHSMTFRFVPAGSNGLAANNLTGTGALSGYTQPFAVKISRDVEVWGTVTPTFANMIASGGWLSNLQKPLKLEIKGSPWLYTSATSVVDPDTPTASTVDQLRLVSPGAIDCLSGGTYTASNGNAASPLMFLICDWDCSFKNLQEYAVPLLPQWHLDRGFVSKIKAKDPESPEFTEVKIPVLDRVLPTKKR